MAIFGNAVSCFVSIKHKSQTLNCVLLLGSTLIVSLRKPFGEPKLQVSTVGPTRTNSYPDCFQVVDEVAFAE